MVQERCVVAVMAPDPRRSDIFYCLFFCLLAGWLLSSCHPDTSHPAERPPVTRGSRPAIAEADLSFAEKAASGGMMELDMARMALNQASAQDVRDFAQMILDDHGIAHTELRALARTRSIVLPAVPGVPAQEKINKLSTKTGPDFDKAYIDMMVSDHEADIAAFEHQSKNGTDEALRDWATRKLPELRHHLDMARELAKQD